MFSLRLLLPPETVCPLPPLQTLPVGTSNTHTSNESATGAINPFANAFSVFQKAASNSLSSLTAAAGNPGGGPPVSSGSGGGIGGRSGRGEEGGSVDSGTILPFSIISAVFFDQTLLIGTSDGQVVSFSVHRDEETGDLLCVEQAKRVAATGRKPIESLMPLVAESKLLVLSDATLLFHSLKSLAPISAASPSFKGLAAVCTDKAVDPPYNFCVAKRRSLQVYYISENSVVPNKEFSLHDTPYLLRKSGRMVLAADMLQYKLIDARNGSVTPLFPYDRNIMRPVVCQIGLHEFLVGIASAGSGGLGMFVNSEGDAVRGLRWLSQIHYLDKIDLGTLQWSAVALSVVFRYPFVFALLKTRKIEVHNILSQELVTVIEIPTDYTNPRLLFSPDVQDLNWNDLANALINEGSLSKGLAIIDSASGLGVWDRKETLNSLYSRAGFLYFKDLYFDEAVRCFKRAEVDPREVIGLVWKHPGHGENPSIDRDGWCSQHMVEKAIRSEEIDDGAELAERVRNAVTKSQNAVTSYILYAKSKEFSVECLEEIDDYLLRIYERLGSTELNAFVSGPNQLNIANAESFLRSKKRFYALTLLFTGTEQWGKAFDIYLGILNGTLPNEEDGFNAVEAVTEFMQRITDAHKFLSFLKKMVEVCNDSLVLRVLSTASVDVDANQVLEICSKSERYDDLSLAYLEHVSADLKTPQLSEIRLHLLRLYTKKVSKMEGAVQKMNEQYWALESRPTYRDFLARISVDDSNAAARQKLFTLVQELVGSEHARCLEAMEQIISENGQLIMERVWLMELQSENFLEIMATVSVCVYELGDFVSAEEICSRAGDNTEESFSGLLKIYLSPKASVRDYEFPKQALRVLSIYPDKFNVEEVLEMFPPRWSLSSLSNFISYHMRIMMSDARSAQISRSLARSQNSSSRYEIGKLYASKKPIVLGVADCQPQCSQCGKMVDSYTVGIGIRSAHGGGGD